MPNGRSTGGWAWQHAGMGTEIELKFRIPAHRLAAVRRAVATTTAVVEPLGAVYLDTPGQHLAAARMALRSPSASTLASNNRTTR